jgi:tRNA (guanine-N7-)-methyltransferase
VVEASQIFGRSAPLVLDIGCGMGESTVAQAVSAPDVDIIALDVHTRGVATLLRHIESADLGNVRTVLGDAVAFIDQRLEPRTVSGARIFFPDPWPKARHHKRRLVQPAFVELLIDRLTPGGFIHCATDDSDYAALMLDVFAASPQLHNPFDGVALLPIPGAVPRPVTKYERRARRMGHPVVDIWVTRTLSP